MNWLEVRGLGDVDSPGLLVDGDLVERNIQRMIELVGGSAGLARLRPHTKTHKMPAIAKMQVDAGISQFKAATLAEAEMLAEAGASDVLLAHQPVGPKISRMRGLVDRYPAVRFSTIVDNILSVGKLAEQLGSAEQPFSVFIDVDCGMHRTGIAFGDGATQLRDAIVAAPELSFAGLHVYDGHLHEPALEDRQRLAGEIIQSVKDSGLLDDEITVIGGGSPTFGVWASETTWQCSPGTTLLWDHGYGNNYPDLDFSVAAALLTRVISKPGGQRVCVDLGHKAVAAEMPLGIRVQLPGVPDAEFVGQSEEHLVFTSSLAAKLNVGDELLAIPKHICPTAALHRQAHVVRDGQVTGDTWDVTARDR